MGELRNTGTRKKMISHGGTGARRHESKSKSGSVSESKKRVHRLHGFHRFRWEEKWPQKVTRSTRQEKDFTMKGMKNMKPWSRE